MRSKGYRRPYSNDCLRRWSAVLNDTPGDWSKLGIAISLYWKRSEIADECDGATDTSILFISAPLTKTEEAVLELIERGKNDVEISHYLDINITSVQYYKITSAEKLTGQSNITRMDL